MHAARPKGAGTPAVPAAPAVPPKGLPAQHVRHSLGHLEFTVSLRWDGGRRDALCHLLLLCDGALQAKGI